jgi:hypothetical protein
MDEIDFLIGWRNRLAHRYLRQRLAGVAAKKIEASPDIAAELAEISNAFKAASARIEKAQTEAMRAWNVGEMPPGLKDLMTLLIADMLTARSDRFRLHTPRTAS